MCGQTSVKVSSDTKCDQLRWKDTKGVEQADSLCVAQIKMKMCESEMFRLERKPNMFSCAKRFDFIRLTEREREASGKQPGGTKSETRTRLRLRFCPLIVNSLTNIKTDKVFVHF